MGVQTTVVFTDLHGSTAVFEWLGNALATQIITEITVWISQQCVQAGGKIIKTLGDGVMAVFSEPAQALDAVVALQREHARRVLPIPLTFHLSLRVGLARGEVEVLDGDCYGDAVNVASRLCSMCGSSQIWATDTALQSLQEPMGVRFRSLGALRIRGRVESCHVLQVEWVDDVGSEALTMQNTSVLDELDSEHDVLGGEIRLNWLGISKTFHSFDLPIQIGRMRDTDFVVNDPRVSRIHARLEWRNGSIVFVDTSSYGSWVRFTNTSPILLRREECILHSTGEFALGSSFSDENSPIINFAVH